MSHHMTRFDSRRGARAENQLRTAMLDSVTHELRTPLTSIKASVTALLANSRLRPSERNDLFIVINEEADRLNQLFGEAVETAHLDDGVKLDLEPHALEEIVDAAREECRTLLGSRSISVQLQPGLPAVCADLRLVKGALRQLLEIAVKYSPADETITITAELNGTSVMTSVVDRGGGIDASEHTLIFEKFYREKDHRYVVEGTGMGLAIASAIIKAHGGSLCVTSRRGQGCSFAFTLPIDPQL